jgi:hypothetical protein
MEPSERPILHGFVSQLFTFYLAAAALVLGTNIGFPADDSGTILKIIRSPNEPVRVIGVRPANPAQSELLIEIENLTAKPLQFVFYTVAPADCPRSDHPAAYNVGYGDWAAVSQIRKAIDPPLPPHGKQEISFPSSVYSGFIRYQKNHGCSPHQRPELYLLNVAFCDGTGWKGFADGPDHSEWNGRDWKPAGNSNCSEPK